MGDRMTSRTRKNQLRETAGLRALEGIPAVVSPPYYVGRGLNDECGSLLPKSELREVL